MYREEIQVLDCTVRDGGLINDHMFEDGLVKAARGLTTLSELYRMLPRLDAPRPLPELRRLVGD